MQELVSAVTVVGVKECLCESCEDEDDEDDALDDEDAKGLYEMTTHIITLVIQCPHSGNASV